MSVALHIHSGTGYLVTSRRGLLVLNSGCPRDSLCNSFTTLLNSASGIEGSIKYGNICLLLGVRNFLCPAYALCPCTNKVRFSHSGRNSLICYFGHEIQNGNAKFGIKFRNGTEVHNNDGFTTGNAPSSNMLEMFLRILVFSHIIHASLKFQKKCNTQNSVYGTTWLSCA